LPDVPVDHHAALDRVLRALTPLPFATAPAGPHMIAPPANVPPPPHRPIMRVASPPPEPSGSTDAVTTPEKPLSPTAFLQHKPRATASAAPAQRPAGTLAPPASTQRPAGTLAPPMSTQQPAAVVHAPAPIAPSAPAHRPAATIAPTTPAAPRAPAAPTAAAPARHSAPRLPAQRTAGRASVTLPSVPQRPQPARETYKPIITPLGNAKRPITLKVRSLIGQRGARLPVYPARRGRWLVRIVVGLFITSALAAGTVVAHPAIIDPLCDDYVWFGADAAHVIRDQASAANAAITQLAHDTRVFYAVDFSAR
jgi:hypothetical protein